MIYTIIYLLIFQVLTISVFYNFYLKIVRVSTHFWIGEINWLRNLKELYQSARNKWKLQETFIIPLRKRLQ